MTVGKQRRKKDEQVFGPLMGSKSFEEGSPKRASLFESAGGNNSARTQLRLQSPARIRHHRFSSSGHERQIGCIVADVNEVVAAEAIPQAFKFPVSGEIADTVAS